MLENFSSLITAEQLPLLFLKPEHPAFCTCDGFSVMFRECPTSSAEKICFLFPVLKRLWCSRCCRWAAEPAAARRPHRDRLSKEWLGAGQRGPRLPPDPHRAQPLSQMKPRPPIYPDLARLHCVTRASTSDLRHPSSVTFLSHQPPLRLLHSQSERLDGSLLHVYVSNYRTQQRRSEITRCTFFVLLCLYFCLQTFRWYK